MSWTPRTLRRVFEDIALQRGSAVALVTPETRVTYRQLLDQAKDAAGAMQALGLKRGDHVGILMGNDDK